MNKIVAQCTVCHRGIDLSADVGKLAFSSSSNGLENLALAVREVMSNAKRRHIGELSLDGLGDGILPWGWIDNRPWLRCLNGFGLCLWRLGRFEDAERVFDRVLWLNPTDKGARHFWSYRRTDRQTG
jgi:hypothetical protein